MRYALFGDVHGNLQAFQAVLKEIDALAPDAILCLGDTVGYGADPVACLSLLRERGIKAIAGNHDYAACGKMPTVCFNDDALKSIRWTHDALDQEQLGYIASLPLTLQMPGLSLAHGTMAAPELFPYILSLPDAVRCFISHSQPFAFVAHTHVPISFVLTGTEVTFSAEASMKIPTAARAIVNVGSVGQPRDGNADAAFCLFDTVARTMELRRVPYDVEAAAEAIVRAGLPQANALRLRLGC